MAVMIIGNLAGGFLHDFIPRGSPERTLVMDLHKSFGLTIIALTLVRLGWRLANPPPPLAGLFHQRRAIAVQGGASGASMA
jgi:cytochrome b561